MRRTLALITLPTLFLASSAAALAQGPLPPPPVPPGNPITAEKAVLGKMLFWDEQLSTDGTMACGTCHQPSSGGADGRLTNQPAHPGPDGISGTPDDIFGSPGVFRSDSNGTYLSDATFGHGVQATNRNSPSMIGAAYFDELFWDGRADGTFRDPITNAVVLPTGGALESQSLEPILSDVEMAYEGQTLDSVVERLERVIPMALATNLTPDMQSALLTSADYPALFQDAFGTDEITPVRIAFALATYQRTLIPDNSKFDRVMRGQANFTQGEQRGFNSFRSPQSRCNQCHSGSLFSDDEFHNLGIRPIPEDNGRQGVTGNFGERGQFKTPSLRNVALRDRFFHNGERSIDSLQDVLNFYDDEGGNFNNNKDPLLNNLRVPPQVRADLVLFLQALTDPRVANEVFPFDRPTLWSERTSPNPAVFDLGAVAGEGGFEPRLTAVAPPKEGNLGFRVGLDGALGGQFAVLHVNLINIPAGATNMDLRNGLPGAQTVEGIGAGNGTLTWSDPDSVDPVLVGLTYDAQWWIRDGAANGGIAKSNFARITIE